MRIDEVLLTSDHVLAYTAPHQAPKRITCYDDLCHDLNSLRWIAALPGIAPAFGGHEELILDFDERVATIERFHRQPLERALEICCAPRTIAEIC